MLTNGNIVVVILKTRQLLLAVVMIETLLFFIFFRRLCAVVYWLGVDMCKGAQLGVNSKLSIMCLQVDKVENDSHMSKAFKNFYCGYLVYMGR
ncbi:hypothetical protein DPMN_170063 [Dreissena polymorpha]|uniref:Uncharacterized protein n=1 Tax=Dreissena polymorpha TaxID=45954 RepID=A0A9D4IDY1_DREPO|nr:hypothetical protein DPMN_170063 [Dreissena polymorpha]